MSELVLIRGDRNFSSWSMRAWLALRQTGAPFEERTIWFDEDPDRARRLEHAPTGRVPVLLHGALRIWDSLAIVEYLAELFPEAGLWPGARASRARARTLCAEMHSCFEDLRRDMPLHCSARKPARDRGPGVARDVARITAMWTETRREFGSGGPYLFGERSAADAYFAPVASRFTTYSVPLEGEAAAYAVTLLETPDVAAWLRDAGTEGRSVPPFADRP